MARPKQWTKDPAYGVWSGMNMRCFYDKHPQFHHYGGRGITICDQWRGRGGFGRFIADVGPRPSSRHQIDRIDNNGNYEPGNVHWVMPKENHRNRRNNHLMTVCGETKTVAEWAEQTGQSYHAIWIRHKRGWSDEDAVRGRCGVKDGRALPKQRGEAYRAVSKLKVGESAVLSCGRSRASELASMLGIKLRTDSPIRPITVTRIS